MTKSAEKKEEADKISLKLQNSKPPKDDLSKNVYKTLNELQPDALVVILPAEKGISTVILNRED